MTNMAGVRCGVSGVIVLLTAVLCAAAGPVPRAFAEEAAGPAAVAGAPPPKPAEDNVVELTLLGAVRQAIETNLDVRVASYDPPRASEALRGAKSVYDPILFGSFSMSRTNRPIQTTLDTGSNVDEAFIEDRWLAQAGVKKQFFTGGNASVSQELDRLDSNSRLVIPNPQSTSRLTGRLTQPLLQGIGDAPNRAAIEVANLNVAISTEEFRQKAADVALDVMTAYWQFVQDRENVRISRTVLEMAEEVLRREQVRLQRGLSKPLDADRARATAESRRGELIRAENRATATENRLRLLLNAPAEQGMPPRKMEPVDAPRVSPFDIDAARARARALDRRPELLRARSSARAGEVRMGLARNKKLPRLDAKFSYTMNSQAGTQRDAVDRVYGSERDSWSAGVEFEWPIMNRGGDAEYRRSAHEAEKARTEVRRIADQVGYEVTVVLDEVGVAANEVRAAGEAREAARRVVASEHARFELGQTTNEELLRAQDFLGALEREYLRAVVGYNVALGRLGRVQGTLLEDLDIRVRK